MINNMQADIKEDIAYSLNEYLNYIDGTKLALIDDYFKLNTGRIDEEDYGDMMDCILFFCLDSLKNSIAVLEFISNGYKPKII